MVHFRIAIGRNGQSRHSFHLRPRLYDGTTLKVYHLQSDGTYARQTRSPAFPFLPLDQIEGFLVRRNETDETTWIRSFRAWVKTLGQ
jgi:hypothetical protein